MAHEITLFNKKKYIFTFYYESLDDALEEGTESIKTIVNPKVANLIEEIKTANRYTPKQRKLRLDSYSKRKIVSRKATTLAEIKESTFIKYLEEIVTKYPEGSKIINKRIGDELKGSFILEIPDLNATFPKLAEYKQIASKFNYKGKEYNIEIKLRAE